MLIICGLILILAIAIITAMMVLNFRDRALSKIKRELTNTGLILSQHSDRSFQALELVLDSIIERMRSLGIASSEDYERQMSGQDIHFMLRDKLSGLSHVDAVILLGADGKLINFSRSWPVAAMNFADREQFIRLKAEPHLRAFIGEPVRNRVTGAWVVYLARPVTAPNGKFLGLVQGAIELAYYDRFFGSIALGDDAAIALFRDDGTMLTRHPQIKEAIGRKYPESPIFQTVLSGRVHGTARLISRLDGKDRLVAARRLEHYPVVVIASTTTSAALAEWGEETKFLLGVGGTSSVVIGVVLFLITRQLLRGHIKSRKILEQQKLHLDTALNNMSQGLVMLDADRKLVFSNRQYAEIYRLPPELMTPGTTHNQILGYRVARGIIPKADAEDYVRNRKATAAVGIETNTIVELSDGRTLSVVVRPVPNGGWVATHEDITERRQAEAQIARMAHYDALTGLPNRVLFRQRIEHALTLASPDKHMAVLCLDLDNFKTVNDTLGHSVGDGLLKAVADRLRGCLRENDTFARLGGDEFAIIQPALVEGPPEAATLAARIRDAMKMPYLVDGHQIAADVSIGISLAPDDAIDADQLLKNADMALYGAKADGRGGYRFFEPEMNARMQARRELELDLRNALIQGEFELHYQPVVGLEANVVTGCEALLRWNHPKRGLISPAAFIPVAEETGLIIQIGEWVLRKACADAAAWPENISVAVNVSPTQFRSPNLIQIIVSALASAGLSAHRLELEITEAVLMQNNEVTHTMLHHIRELGVHLSMDDFGTGYSSLSYLRSFPFDKIKIDRSFVNDLSTKHDSLAIIRAVIGLASSLHMTTIAEGVETQQQLEIVKALGCTEIQGYLFSHPRPADEIFQFFPKKSPMEADTASAA